MRLTNIKTIARLGPRVYFSFTDIPHSTFYAILENDIITVIQRQPKCWEDYTVAIIRDGKVLKNVYTRSSKFIKYCVDYYSDILEFYTV